MTTPWPIVALLMLVGLLIGSFLNVIVYRVPRGESVVFPGSHCPACDAPIRARDNVPVVSWLLLRGRCAGCAGRIGARYPLVEAASAALFGAITLHFGLSAELPAYLFLAAVGITLALIDMDTRLTPNSIVLPAYVVSVFLLMPAGAVTADWRPAVRALAGVLALLSIYAVLAFADPVAVNFGNVKLAGLLGLYLGWLSWSTLVVGAIGSLVIGATARLVSPAGRHDRSLTIAFGPPMVVATGAALFLTVPLTQAYSALVSAV